MNNNNIPEDYTLEELVSQLNLIGAQQSKLKKRVLSLNLGKDNNYLEFIKLCSLNSKRLLLEKKISKLPTPSHLESQVNKSSEAVF